MDRAERIKGDKGMSLIKLFMSDKKDLDSSDRGVIDIKVDEDLADENSSKPSREEMLKDKYNESVREAFRARLKECVMRDLVCICYGS